MGISLLQPLWLIIIPLGVLMVFLHNRHVKSLVKWRRYTVMTTRILVIVFLVLSLTGMRIKSFTDERTIMIVVDRSDSMKGADHEITNFIKRVIDEKRPTDKIGIVSFGAHGAVEQSVSEQPIFNGFAAKVESNYSGVEEGLQLAYSLMSDDTGKQVILMTDGEENIGDALQQARMLKEHNVLLDVWGVQNTDVNDVQLSKVSLPDVIHLGESFDVVIRIDSNIATRTKIDLYANRQLVGEQTAEIQKGENQFVFKDTAAEGGSIVYKAVIDPENDEVLANNEFSRFSYVKDIPKILVVQGYNEDARELIKIYETDSSVTVAAPASVPQKISELQQYDSIILSNVSAHELNNNFLEALEVYVRHLGKGLVVTGGEDSYALGGYFKTPLEKILPVNMELKNKADVPNLGLVLVIDKSGSMSDGQYGVSKIELAKEAALRSTEALKEEDEIGVIAFDGAVQWAVKTGKIEDIRAVQEKIGSIRAGGGTSILPALDEAVKSLVSRDTKLKHIILLTDGQAEKNGYGSLIETMQQKGITLSAVAVGTGADLQLLRHLAEEGKGRFYKTDEFSDLPKIFTKETFLAGRTYINHRTFTPVRTGMSEILNGITAVPELHGYIGTSAKQTAKVILSSDNREPILAAWQYGLGRTAAWTPDAKGQWSSDWMGWEKAQVFWKNVLSWTLQHHGAENYEMNSEIIGNQVQLDLVLDESMDAKEVKGIVIAPDMEEQEIDFTAAAPGKYVSDFEGNTTGAYLTRIHIMAQDGEMSTIRSGIVLPYSPEYDLNRAKDRTFLAKLAQEGGGKLVEKAEDVLKRHPEKVWSETDLTSVFLILAMMLFMIDIAVRRLHIPSKKLQAIVVKLQMPAKIKKAWTKARTNETPPIKPAAPGLKKTDPNKTDRSNQVPREDKPKTPDKKDKTKQQQTSHTSKLLEFKRKRKK